MFAPVKLEQRHMSDSALGGSFRSDDTRSLSSSDAGSANMTSSFEDVDLALNDSVSLEPLEGATGGSFMDELLSAAATKDAKTKRHKYSFYTGASGFTTAPHGVDSKYPLKVRTTGASGYTTAPHGVNSRYPLKVCQLLLLQVNNLEIQNATAKILRVSDKRYYFPISANVYIWTH